MTLIHTIIYVAIIMKTKMRKNMLDTNEFVHQEASQQYKFGRTTSIRVKDEEFWPIIIFGQDVSAFHQFLLE